MSLAEQQRDFMRAILDEKTPLPKGWGNSHALGLSVYRGNYRNALMEALANSFERTRLYAGEEAFRQAGINHLIDNPPSHWTIDAVGAGFDVSCKKLFPSDPAMAELAWLEWTMLELATAPDTTPLTPQNFAEASAGFGDAEWLGLSLTFQPRAAAREVEHDLTALWKALGAGERASARRLDTAQGCIVWREGERPTFITVDAETARAFIAMQFGARYGDLITLIAGEDPDEAAIQQAAGRAGGMLGQWLSEEMVIAIDA